jgi:alkylhydroperoxidase family enzyme
VTRIPYPDVESLSAEKRAVLFGDAPVLNISRMSMHASDELWKSWRSFARVAFHASKLDPGLRELVILRVAYLSRSEYEIYHHLSSAVELGVPAEKCSAMESGDFACLAPEERAAVEFASQIVESGSPSDPTLAEIRRHYVDEIVFNIVLLTGAYMTVARIIATGGLQCDEVAGPGLTERQS